MTEHDDDGLRAERYRHPTLEMPMPHVLRHFPTHRVLAAFAFVGLSACGPVVVDDAGAPDDEDAGGEVPLESAYVSSGAVTGPRLTLDVALDGERTAVIRVRAHELGDVFGYAFHVVTGDLVLPDLHALTVEPALGGALEATYAARVDERVKIGAARNALDAGAALTDGAELLRFTVSSEADGVFPLEVARGFVRRSDGSIVVPKLEQGTLTLAGDAS